GIRSHPVAAAAAESAARTEPVDVVVFHRPTQLASHPRAADDVIEPPYCGTLTRMVAVQYDVRRYRRETCRSAINPRGIFMESSGAKIAFWRRMARRSCAISISRDARSPCRFRRSRRLRWSVISTAILLTSCAPAGVLDPQGPIASAERLLLINSTAIMLVVVIPVIVATLAFAWWYRSSNTRATRSLDESYEGRVEFVVWSIPALTVILLGGVIWIGSHQLDPRTPIPSKSDPLRVDVVALDWKWLFIYPDHGVATVNQLVIPAGTPIEFRLTSATVMNSFFVPQLGSQI